MGRQVAPGADQPVEPAHLALEELGHHLLLGHWKGVADLDLKGGENVDLENLCLMP